MFQDNLYYIPLDCLTQNLNVGDLAVIQTDNMTRSHWPLDRITETCPGVDGVVITVRVKTASNELLQLAQKLSLLESWDI